MLAQGHGIGIREADGRWVATALALPLGADLSWISMVLVTRAARGRGFGTRLLKHCIDRTSARGAAAGLDATEFGRPVYLKLGFRDLYPISRWRVPAGARLADTTMEGIRPVGRSDIKALASFDEERSGIAREHILQYLAAAAPSLAWLAEARGRVVGYGLGRPGRLATQIGPIVADFPEIACALLVRCAKQIHGPIMLDVPDNHEGVGRLLESAGAVRERGFMRMVFGDVDAKLTRPNHVFALAGPELG
jgi:predicted GNAT family acetyltransferase